MLEVYRTFAEDWMAMPVLTGPKSDGQKFPGAVYTLCIEAMMQDRQGAAGGDQPFPRPEFRQGVRRQVPERRPGSSNTPGPRAGASRPGSIGGLIMTHSDDSGLVAAAAAGADPRRHRAARQKR